jgi:alginate O-acetyltransferase complex protein AlgI
MLEARRGQVAAPAPASYFAYFFFFPSAPSGPIKSLRRFLANAPTPRWPAMDDLGAGAARLTRGLAKKIILAESCAPLAAGFAHPAQATSLELWIAVYAYALQIYFDFSGYTDMALGMARLLGYRVEENFDWPYLKSNLRDFWRAWHMSLTGFMREAVYIPLGGSRVGEGRLYRNLIVVFALIGLWHGGQSHFLLWGLYHGLGMAGYRAWRLRLAPRLTKNGRPPIGRAVGWLLTFHFVALGWILFACETSDAGRVFWRLFVELR